MNPKDVAMSPLTRGQPEFQVPGTLGYQVIKGSFCTGMPSNLECWEKCHLISLLLGMC